MRFRRRETDNLLKLLKSRSREVIIVEGARQVGKTTLVNDVLSSFPKAVKINLETDLRTLKGIDSCEKFSELELYLNNSFGFEDRLGAVLFIDEAQESENLGRFIRSFKESWQHAKVVLSGSSMTRLFREEQRIPVGRYTTVLVKPLTFVEFLRASKANGLLQELERFRDNPLGYQLSELSHQLFLERLDFYLAVGGLPEVVARFLAKEDWRKKRLEIYLSQEEDFVRKSEINSRILFSSVMRAIANNLGSPSKFSQMADKQHEAKKTVHQLQAWKLVYEISQKGNSPTSTFMPKRYLYDIGIAQDLREHPFPNLSVAKTLSAILRTPLGGLVENALLLQLIGEAEVYGISAWKLQSDSNKEIDFVVRTTELFPVEVKSALKNSHRNFHGLKEYLQVAQLDIGFLVSLAPFEVIKEKNGLTMVNLPFYLAEIDSLKLIREALRSTRS